MNIYTKTQNGDIITISAINQNCILDLATAEYNMLTNTLIDQISREHPSIDFGTLQVWDTTYYGGDIVPFGSDHMGVNGYLSHQIAEGITTRKAIKSM